jgi:hypothetical protein
MGFRHLLLIRLCYGVQRNNSKEEEITMEASYFLAGAGQVGRAPVVTEAEAGITAHIDVQYLQFTGCKQWIPSISLQD